MASLRAILVALIYAVTVYSIEVPHPLSDEFIDLINSKQTTWRAGRNFPENTSMKHIKKLMGALTDENLKKLPVVTHTPELISSLPDNFDPKDKWPNCPTLNEIRDQGSCGSCWAFGAVEAMTDRVCTYSNGTKHFHFSAEDLLSCCLNCGLGCDGGYLKESWDYWKKSGLVSGGNYNSSEGCRPYEIPPCEHHMPGKRPPCKDGTPTPDCKTTCENGYNVDYEKDKRYGKNVYYVESDEDHIRAELFQNGPVEAAFTVYADFLHIKAVCTSIPREISWEVTLLKLLAGESKMAPNIG